MSIKKSFIAVISLILLSGLGIVRVNAVCSDRLPSSKYPQATAAQCIQWEKNAELEKVECLQYEEIEEATYDIAETIDYNVYINEEDVKTLGNVVYGEARGLNDTERSAVVWCILNRLDNGNYGKTIYEVTTAKSQFSGYNASRTYKSDEAKALLYECEELARDVLLRYYMEKDGVEDVGRTLPSTYLYFLANDTFTHNVYTEKWHGTTYWDWSLESPYVE